MKIFMMKMWLKIKNGINLNTSSILVKSFVIVNFLNCFKNMTMKTNFLKNSFKDIIKISSKSENQKNDDEIFL